MRIKEMPQGSGGLLVKVAYWFSLRWFGKIVDPVKVMCHHLWVLLGSVAFEMAFGRAKEIERRRMSYLRGCENISMNSRW